MSKIGHQMIINCSGHNRKEDLIPVENDRTWGYELFQSLVIKAEVPVGAAVTELRCRQGLLSSQSDVAIPVLDHLEQAERKNEFFDEKVRAVLAPSLQLVDLKSLRIRIRIAIDILSEHISQQRLEGALGLSQGYLSRLRAGTGNPSPALGQSLGDTLPRSTEATD